MSENNVKNTNLVEWVDGETPVNSVHLNDIKNKIISNSNDINKMSNAMLSLQTKNDSSLETTNKNISSAINELKREKFDKVSILGNVLKFYANNIEKYSITLPENQEIDLTEINNSLATKYDNVILEGQNLKFYVGEVLKKTITLPAGEGGSVDLSGYQTKNDSTLTTKNKTVAGAINEIALDTSQNKIKLEDHLSNHPNGGDSFTIITPNGKAVIVKATNDGTLEAELPVIPEESLPSDFPKFTVTGESDYKYNFLVTPHTNDKTFGYIFIINNKGQILWYKKTNKGYCYAFKKYKNSKGKNRYTYLESLKDEPAGAVFYENCELVVLNENFDEIDRVRHKKYGDIPYNYPAESHDYVYIDDGHYMIASYFIPKDSSLWENSIQEIKMGKVIWHWQTTENTELKTLSHTTPTGDYAHINSIQIDYDSNLLISFRNIGLLKLNKSTKEIMWVIGKNRCDFEGVETSQIPFQQHDIQFVGDGSFTVFDNYGHASKSRICRFFLDEDTMTCLAYKEYITTQPKSAFMGSATIIDDENDLIDIAYGGGLNLGFEEYDFKNNRQVMKLVFNDGHDMYRVFRDIEFRNNSKLEIINPDNVPVKGVSLPNSFTISKGKTQKITATLTPSNATNKNVLWSKDNDNINIEANGLTCNITGVNVGETILTVTTEDGSKVANCTILINEETNSNYLDQVNFNKGKLVDATGVFDGSGSDTVSDLFELPVGSYIFKGTTHTWKKVLKYEFSTGKYIASESLSIGTPADVDVKINTPCKIRVSANGEKEGLSLIKKNNPSIPTEITINGSESFLALKGGVADYIYIEIENNNFTTLNQVGNITLSDNRFYTCQYKIFSDKYFFNLAVPKTIATDLESAKIYFESNPLTITFNG